ncbi:MAG TPA: hypothetical protein VKC64_04355 [Burkholderiales bacterium]|nr:hypothetical protein [Burkholderiales bacterium]
MKARLTSNKASDHRERTARDADQRGGRNLDVREPQDAARYGAATHVVVALEGEPRRVARHEEGRQPAPVARGGVGACEDVEHVGVEEADGVLLAVQHPHVAATVRTRLHPAHVGAGFRLGQAEADDGVPGEQRRDPPVAERGRRLGEELALQCRPERRQHAVEVAARDLFGRDPRHDEVALGFAPTPELRGEAQHRAHLLVRVAALRVALGISGQQLGQGERAQPRAVLLLRRREGEIEHDQGAGSATRSFSASA